VDGEVGKPAEYALDDLIKLNQLEERIYRFAASRDGRW